MNEAKVTHKIPGGGSITVTVRAEGPVTEKEFPILGKSSALFNADALMGLADFFSPKPKIVTGGTN